MSFDLELVNGDIAFDAQGRLELVRDTDKLTQDVLKILETTLGSDVFDQNYGVSVNQNTVGQVIANNSIPAQVQAEIQGQLVKLQQEQQALASVQVITPAERIQLINNVTVVRDSIEPRQLNISIQLTAQNTTPITINTTVTL